MKKQQYEVYYDSKFLGVVYARNVNEAFAEAERRYPYYVQAEFSLFNDKQWREAKKAA